MQARAFALLGFIVVTIAILDPMPPRALAGWRESGVPVAPAVQGIAQRAPNLCSDGANGAFIVWVQWTNTDGGDAYLQRLTASGDVASGWPVTGLALSTRPNQQFASNLAPDMFGGVYVIWSSYEDPQVLRFRLQRILSNGTIAPGWPATGLLLPVGSPFEYLDGVCGDGQGGVYVISTATDSRVLVLHYTGTGETAPGWNPLGQPVSAVESGKGLANIIPDSNGGFLAIWLDSRGGVGGLGGTHFALRVTSSGDPAPGWPPGGVRVNSIPTVQEYRFMISDGAGGAYVGWDDNRNGVFPPIPLDYDIYGQHILANGTIDPRWPADGLPIVVRESAQYFFEMAEDGAGGVIFVWDDYGAGGQIYAVRIRPDGSVAPGWTANGSPVAPHPFLQTIPSAVGDGSGGVYAFWDQGNAAGNQDILGQHLDAQGAPAPGWPVIGRLIAASDATYGYDHPTGTSDGTGGAIVAYERGSATSRLIYAQRVLADGPVPTRIAFLDSEVEPGIARLRWSASDASSSRTTVYRRQGDEPWTQRGSPNSVGESVLEFEDSDLEPGLYAYRLGVTEGVSEYFTEESWVEVPAAFRLELAGFQPNPAVGALVLGFTLPSDGPASITVHDVRGRAVLAKDVSSLGPGRHRLDLGRDPRITPGVYWVQLVHGGQVRRARGVVLQ